jgi:hypothetical protein
MQEVSGSIPLRSIQCTWQRLANQSKQLIGKYYSKKAAKKISLFSLWERTACPAGKKTLDTKSL